MSYTLGEAARATGRTKATLQEAIKKGRISAQKDPFGCWRIDPAELHRVYPPQAAPVSRPAPSPAPRPDAAEPPPAPAIPPEQREELIQLRERVAGLERFCRQVEGERDSLREQNTRLTALLPKPTALADGDRPSKPLFWTLFRRRLGSLSQG